METAVAGLSDDDEKRVIFALALLDELEVLKLREKKLSLAVSSTHSGGKCEVVLSCLVSPSGCWGYCLKLFSARDRALNLVSL